MDKNKNYQILQKYARTMGSDVFGVADISSVKDKFLFSKHFMDKFDNAIVAGIRLSEAVLSEIVAHPTRLYFHHYRTVNATLDQLALRLTNLIQQKGFLALAIPASQIVDWEKQSGHLSHKKIAQLAGIGWIGRNNLLVHKNLGCALRLVSVLTNMPLTVDRPVIGSCGTCRLCISVCPAQAIKENPADFDHLKCFEKLKEFQREKYVDQYICGICVKVCKGKNK